MCLVGEMEKRRDEKLFYLFERKNEKMENEVVINLQLCFHYKKRQKERFFFFFFLYNKKKEEIVQRKERKNRRRKKMQN